MEYYFNNLNPTQFQRLINTILTARFGEDTRLTPLRGKDGGRDGETAPNNPNFEYQVKSITPTNPAIAPPKPGRYLFQVKHHSTIDTPTSGARQSVISDFKSEFKKNVMGRTGDERVNYFFLITNVPSSRDSLIKLDQIRSKLLEGYENLHTDIWWQEQLVGHLA